MEIAQFTRRQTCDSPDRTSEKLRAAAQMIEDVAYVRTSCHTPKQIAHLTLIAASLARIAAASGEVEEELVEKLVAMSR